MLVLVVFAFLAGFATILSPCILPVLPIVLASSTASGKKRPFGIVSGFVASFTFFTLALTFLVKATGIDPNVLRSIAVVVILVFGISMLIPQVIVWLEILVSKLSAKVKSNKEESDGFLGGLFLGLGLGLVWTPCAGPILASVITLAATSELTIQAIFITLSYAIGTSIPMIGIIYGGRGLLKKVPFLLKNSAKIQKVFGVIIILVAVGMFLDYDRKFQAYVLEKFPQYGSGITKIEELDVVNKQLEALNMNSGPLVNDDSGQCVANAPKAPGFEEGGEWLNSPALDLAELRGKVVLVDFWTYTCINCIRTLPYLNAWQEKYADDGLVIVGVHTPEFEFEKDKGNLEEAIADFEIKYPVVQDNDYKIWRSYKNRYWPAKYFVDKNGCVRSAHFGEGDYDGSEKLIQELLAETGADVVGGGLVDVEEYQSEGAKTPESYLGYGRLERFSSPESVKPEQNVEYSLPENLEVDHIGYGGIWKLSEERAMPASGSSLELNFQAKDVYLVMRSVEGGRVKVSVDGKVVTEEAGDDVKDGVVNVMTDRLYKLVKYPKNTNGILHLDFLDDGIEVYAFTFG